MGTHFSGQPEEVRALDVYIKLMRATDTLTNHLHNRLVESRLSLSQLAVLEALLHLGPMCQRDLGRKLLKSGGNITTVVDNLERRELVNRVRNRSDRRFITLHLTNLGREVITAVFPGHARRIVQALDSLAPAEQEELARLCKKLGVAVAARRPG